MDRPGATESEALDRETPLRVCLDSDAPPEIEYYDLSHEFDVKMLHPVRDDQLQVFSARFNEVFRKCQCPGNICFLHGISTHNGRVYIFWWTLAVGLPVNESIKMEFCFVYFSFV